MTALTHLACACPCGCVDHREGNFGPRYDVAGTRCQLCFHAGDRPHFILHEANGARFTRWLGPRVRWTMPRDARIALGWRVDADELEAQRD